MAINQPIHLALRVTGPGVTMAAAADAVSIVRWVAGESKIWIRVQQSSNMWLDNGAPTGPSFEHMVSWNIGVSARISDRFNDLDAGENGSNLPFNTRDTTAQEGDFADAASTLFCADFSQSNLFSDGARDSLMDYDIIAYDHNAEISPGVYSGLIGNNTGINFTNDTSLARGKTRDCDADPAAQATGSSGPGTGALSRYTKGVNLQLACQTGNNFIPPMLFPGSAIRITAQQPGFGFKAVGSQILNGSSYLVVNPASLINIGGEDLYTEVDLFWDGAFVNLNETLLQLELWLEYDGGNVPSFQVGLEPLLVNNPGARDEAPYDGDNQNRYCEPSIFPIQTQSITLDPPGP